MTGIEPATVSLGVRQSRTHQPLRATYIHGKQDEDERVQRSRTHQPLRDLKPSTLHLAPSVSDSHEPISHYELTAESVEAPRLVVSDSHEPISHYEPDAVQNVL